MATFCLNQEYWKVGILLTGNISAAVTLCVTLIGIFSSGKIS